MAEVHLGSVEVTHKVNGLDGAPRVELANIIFGGDDASLRL